MTPHQLAAENERLREENEILRSTLAPALAIPAAFGFTPMEEAVFSVLYARDHATYDALAIALRKPTRDSYGRNTMKVRVCLMRKKLAKHGITVETMWDFGYRLAPEMKERVRALLGAR